MTRALQKKFVVTAMIAVTVLLLVVLGALNVFNAITTTRQSERLLEELGRQSMPAQMSGFDAPAAGDAASSFSGQFSGNERRTPNTPLPHRGFWDEPLDDNARMSAVYFTVELDAERQVLHSDVTHIATVSADEAAAMATALNPGQDSGTVGSFRYRIFSNPDGHCTVVFLNSSIRRSAVMRVLLLSVLLGGISWLLMLALVIALSRRAIRPIAENMERQRRFVTDAGHELKTPLAIILANADALELRSGETKYSRNIRAQALRLSDLMKNLLTLARMDEFSIRQNASPLDFSALCNECFTTFQEPADLKNLSFTFTIPEGISVTGDHGQLLQLCSILADNAVKYTPAGGEIHASLAVEDRRVCMRISNTVQDVPDLDHIFDRFYRSDQSRNQKTGGFGIGLSAAQAIARLHRAELRADYDKASSVLCFTVVFPA